MERQLNILNVVGARPNMMKIAPIVEEMNKNSIIKQTLLHTGQHYDERMSMIFFDELAIPKPDIYLGVGSGTHAQQTARIMTEFERVLLDQRPDMVLVVGDVNSTLACSVTAAKMQLPIAHVEAGLRSFDRTMPEEINRLVTDALADFLFTTEKSANENLLSEGIQEKKIFFVGNVMIDTLKKYKRQASNLKTTLRYGVEVDNYVVLTLHRPSNVDKPDTLGAILEALTFISNHIRVVFPVHPRTHKRLQDFQLLPQVLENPNLVLIKPLGYLQFLDLMMHAKIVLTDSGGIQEETTILGIPCLTLRENTERPVTVLEGTNRLVGSNPDKIIEGVTAILNGKVSEAYTPELWDGKAAVRIVQILSQNF